MVKKLFLTNIKASFYAFSVSSFPFILNASVKTVLHNFEAEQLRSLFYKPSPPVFRRY